MILSSGLIQKRLEQSGTDSSGLHIVPAPQINTQSDSASVDLRLGCWFTTFRVTQTSHFSAYSDAQKLVTSDQAAQQALTAKSGNRQEKSEYIPFGSRFVLHPGQFTLAVTLEWLRMPHDLCAYVSARSSWARYGLLLATATGVHPGFAGCLTLELSNIGVMPIELLPGTAICQLFLHSVEGPTQPGFRDSRFVGNRRPVVPPVAIDPILRMLMAPDSGWQP